MSSREGIDKVLINTLYLKYIESREKYKNTSPLSSTWNSETKNIQRESSNILSLHHNKHQTALWTQASSRVNALNRSNFWIESILLLHCWAKSLNQDFWYLHKPIKLLRAWWCKWCSWVSIFEKSHGYSRNQWRRTGFSFL